MILLDADWLPSGRVLQTSNSVERQHTMPCMLDSAGGPILQNEGKKKKKE